MNPYSDTDDGVVDTFGRVHGNGEQTHVAILECGDRAYVALAYDVRPQDFTPIAAEFVGYDPTADGIRQRADHWMEANPKGIASDGSDDGGSRVLAAVKNVGGKVNDYGNTLAEKQQQQQGDNQ